MVAYDELSEALILAVPELRVPYEIEKKTWRGEKPPQHVIFGNIVPPFLEAELQQGQRKDVLQRVFSYLEDMASHPYVLVQEVVQQEVLVPSAATLLGSPAQLLSLVLAQLL
jgi:hypothetical protein